MPTETKEKKPARKLTVLESILISIAIFLIGVGVGDVLITKAVMMVCGGAE